MSDLNKTTYLPEEMAEEIQGLKEYIGTGGGGTNLDEIAFGEMTEEELRENLTNPGITDPKYYEEIAEAIIDLEDSVNLRDYDIFIDKNITQNGEYVAFDDNAYGYATVRVNVSGGVGGGDVYGLIDRTIVDANFPNTSIVGSYAFMGCTLLVNASFPACVEISQSAFQNCINLQRVSFPVCEAIGSSAFYQCVLLESVIFPACKYLNGPAFQECHELVTASFPNCLSMSRGPFLQCSKLSNVYFPVCTHIAGFGGCGLREASFPLCLSIYDYTFRECSSLYSISLPVCNYVGSSAFRSCQALTDINLSVCTYIGEGAFVGCYNLSAIYLMGSSFCSAGMYILGSNSHVSASIYVPESLYYSYIQAPNWSYYSSQFVGCLSDGTPVLSIYSASYSENVLYLGGDGVSMNETVLALSNSFVRRTKQYLGSSVIWALKV